MKRFYLKCIIDAIILYIFMHFIQDYVLSIYFGESQIRDIFIMLSGVVVTSVFFFYVFILNDIKTLLKGLGINFLSFLGSVVIGFFFRFLLPFRFFPIHNTSNAVGFVVIIVNVLFLIQIFIIRIIIVIIRITTIRKHNKKLSRKNL